MVTKRYDAVLDALGDGTRRVIVERLRRGPRSVADIASGLPVSRPAVSKHLRILKRAGIVADRAVGAQRFYELDLDAFAALHLYVERFWDTALARFKDAAERRPEEEGRR